jgi:uncharacterized pyridoxamine 5'-phosphate oxidase family protein
MEASSAAESEPDVEFLFSLNERFGWVRMTGVATSTNKVQTKVVVACCPYLRSLEGP